jgi:tetratricopeptide (TPR) repeat protein
MDLEKSTGERRGRMFPYPYERRSGRDRRSGADRRKIGEDDASFSFSDEEMSQEESEEKAAQMRLHLGDLWNHKGKELFRTHRYPEAKEALLKAVEIKPELADAWYVIACIESMKSEKEGALSRLRKAIELEPGYKEKARTQSYFKKLKGDVDFDRLVQ